MNGMSPSKYVPSSPICTEPFSSRYSIQEDIGRGKFAVVRKCVNLETGEVVAAKVIRKRRKGKSCREEILREVVMLELAMAHPRLVSLREVFETQSELILVTEYCAGGELFQECVINESFKEDDVRKLLAQILEGLVYLHDNNIVHLDLKPQNILLTKPFPDGEVKICDLGFACLTDTGEDIRDIIGTPDYVAPEVLDYEALNIQTDMWSLGVLTYVMLTTYSPFVGDTQQETFCNITQIKVDFPDDLFGHINPLAQDFISKLLVKQPRDRMTARQCLEHPWLSDLKTSMSIKMPVSDHSSGLAHDMVTPSNWHMSPDRCSSLTSVTDLPSGSKSEQIEAKGTDKLKAEGVERQGRASSSEEKDVISNTLSHIDIDTEATAGEDRLRGFEGREVSSERSSLASFVTCEESIPEGDLGSYLADMSTLTGSVTDSNQEIFTQEKESTSSDTITPNSITTATATESLLTNYALDVVDGAIASVLDSRSDHDSDHPSLVTPTAESESDVFLETKQINLVKNNTDGSLPNSIDTQDTSSKTLSSMSTSQTSFNSSSSRDTNKLKRMSMEIPPKKAKCVEEAASCLPCANTPAENEQTSTFQSGATSQCVEQQGQNCNGVEDFRNAV